jgi:transcriptional regulator with XRE-family HTH domain
MGNIVREMLDSAGFSVIEAAEISGVPKSNIYRYLSNEAAPTIEVVSELALACNLSLELRLAPLSDPHAAEAAKWVLGASAKEPIGEVNKWVSRIERQHFESEFDVIEFAGRASNPLHRQGAQYFRGSVNALTVASAGEMTGKDWALSGSPVLEALELNPVGIPLILWAADAEKAGRAMEKSAARLPLVDGANITIVPALSGELQDSSELEGIRIVSVLQGLLDVVGISDTSREQVLAYVERMK